MKTRKWTPRIEALEDRNMMSATPLSVVVPESTAGMLLPAVQKVREAAAADSHKGTIEIQSWSLGESNPGAVRLKWEKLTVPATDEAAYLQVKLSDVLVSSLTAADADETHIKEAVLTARKAGRDQVVLPFAASFEVVGGVADAALKAGWDVASNKKL